MTIYALMYSFLNFEPVCCSTSSSNCYFLTCIQIAQEAGKVVWHSHIFKHLKNLRIICRVHHMKCQPGWNTSCRINLAGKNVNNIRYPYDTTFMAESEEELKSLLMKVKEKSEKADSKLNIRKTKIMASVPFQCSHLAFKITDYSWKVRLGSYFFTVLFYFIYSINFLRVIEFSFIFKTFLNIHCMLRIG